MSRATEKAEMAGGLAIIGGLIVGFAGFSDSVACNSEWSARVGVVADGNGH